MSAAVRFVPLDDDAAPETLTVAGTPAVKSMRPDAIACLTLLSDHRLFTMTCDVATFSTGTPGTSPFLNPSPTENGRVPLTPDVNWNEVTWPGVPVPEVTVKGNDVVCDSEPDNPV